MNRRPLETRRLRADTLAEIRHQLRHISPPLVLSQLIVDG
jgi:hypothetical protein